MFLILIIAAKICCQQSSKQEALSYLNFPQINLQQEYVIGSVSKYTPLSYNPHIENEEIRDSNSYLIYVAKQIQTKEHRIIYYVEFLFGLQKIVHHFLVSQCSNFIEVQFNIDILNYEGTWCFHYLYFTSQTELIIGFDCGYFNEIKRYDSDINCFQDLIYIYEQSIEIFKEQSQQTLMLLSLPGYIKIYQLKNIILLDDYKIQYYQGLNQELIVDPLIQYIQYSSLNIQSLISKFIYNRSYAIQFWSKINITDINQNQICILQLRPHDLQSKLELNVFKLSYQKNQEQWSYIIDYYSYNYPYIKNQDIIKEFQKSFSQSIDEDVLTQWHFIKIKYLMNILIFQLNSFLTNKVYEAKFTQVYQFSDVLLNFQFGENESHQNNIDGEIASLNYFNYVSLIDQYNNLEISQICHFSCLNCWGPFNNQCSSCQESDDRIFNPKTNTCKCKLWYVEDEQQNCHGSSELNFKEVHQYLPDDNSYQSKDQKIICSFGYFQVKDQCIQCPSSSQKGTINCIQCLVNPQKWMKEGFCEEQYIQSKGSLKNVYSLNMSGSKQAQQFFIVNEEVVSCDGCYKCSEQEIRNEIINCFLYDDKHLDEDVYISCFYNDYDSENKKCVEDNVIQDRKSKCGDYCGYCMFKKCLYCKDSSKYFMDVLGFCRSCEIKNCKYCFQYNILDHNQVSVLEGEISQNVDDYIIACSLCFPGYIFNFSINQCVNYAQNDSCINGFIQDGQFKCTQTLLSYSEIQKNSAIQFSDCQQLHDNCLYCLQDFFGIIQCLECNYGYFLNYLNGICQKCSDKYENSELCIMTSSSQDNWKYQVQSFYINFKPNKIPIFIQGLYFVQWYEVLKCQDGYLQYGLECIKLKNRDCLEYDGTSQICKICKDSPEGTPVQSYFDMQCQNCPFQCQVCQGISQDLIQNINPYFIFTDQLIQTYYCLQSFNEKQTFIESYTGQIRQKDESNRRYYSELEIENFPSFQNLNLSYDDLIKYLKKIKPLVVIQKFNSSKYFDPINIREKIFSVKNSTFIYNGKNDSYREKQFVITNQSTVSLENVRIFHQSNNFLIHSTFGVSIFISNISISNLDMKQTIFLITEATNLYIHTIQLFNIKLINKPLISVKHYENQPNQQIQIHIENLILINSTLINTSIVQFLTNSNSEFSLININLIHIINSELYNSQIINFNSISFNTSYSASNILFQNSSMIESILFRIPISKQVDIKNIDIIQCKFQDSIFISQLSSIYLNNISIYQSTFIKSSFMIFSQLFQVNGQYNYLLQNLTFNTIDLCESSLVSIKNDKDFIGYITINNIQVKNISSSCQNICDTNQCVFSLSNYQISIEHALINNENNIWFFCLQKFTSINIKNILVQGNDLFTTSYILQKVQSIKETLTQGQENCGIIHIQEFVNIDLYSVKFENQFIQNSALIQIISKGQALNYQNINITFLSFVNNYLIKTESTQFSSLLYINSEYYCDAIIQQSQFSNNLILHFIEDYTFISPGLIYIQVYQQSIQFYKNIFDENTILNTSNALIYLNANQVKISEISVLNLNSKYQIFSNVVIKSIGGLIFAKVESFEINNSVFKNVYAYQASCLYLEMIRLGIIKLNNIVIQNGTSWSQDQENAVGGCLYIISMNSNLNLELNQIQVKNCKSKSSNGFLYLIPSTINNWIQFNDIVFFNVFSQNQFIFYFDFEANSQLNYVSLSNIIIIFEENDYNNNFSKYFDKANQSQNSVISIFNSNIKIKNLYFEGFSPSSILILQFSKSIILSNLYFNKVNSFGNNLISILNKEFIQSQNQFETHILNIVIRNISILKSNIFEKNQDNFTINSFLSLKISKVYSNQKIQLYLTQIFLRENFCYACLKGLISLNLNQNLQKCKITEIFLQQNNCGQFSCLFVDQCINVEMSHSMFISNMANYQGVTNLQINNFKGKNLYFLNNSGILGGGLYYKSDNELNNLRNIYFVNNSAVIGGAIYIEGSRISPNKLSQIFFIENQSKDLTQNVREQPSQLQLSVFGQKIITIKDENLGKPNFTKYNTQNFIYIPSGQKIGIYEQSLSNKVILNKVYNIKLQILPINTLGEVQVEEQNSVCSLDLSEYINKNNKIIRKAEKQEQIIMYNISSQSFDLSNLTIVLDPYSKDIEFSRFKFKCNCIRNSKYTFQFNAKSFTCKMGEYYFDAQCLQCDFKKGFYSVEVNAQNCQKVDPKSIKSNTINNIELYPGYWRPNMRSHYITKCLKNMNNCLGGWKTGDDSCLEGSIGALCEECDIYDIRGQGQYFKNQSYECIICNQYAGKVLYTLFVNMITIISIYLTVISVNSIFKSFKLLKNTTLFYRIIFSSNLDQSAALIKMIVNYCQIIVSIKSFQQDLYLNIADILMPISNPIGISTFSYECYFAIQQEIEIIYLSQIMYIMLPALYYLLFLSSYLTLVIFRKMVLTSTIYFTALIYLFFYTQPNIIKQFGGLIAKRTISQIDYINLNTQYLYNTQEHSNWIRFFISPVLIIFGGIIPLLLLVMLYKKRNKFNFERTRKIWGYLYNDYKEDSYYWEIIKIFQRELIMLSLIINEERVIMKSIITLLVLFLYYFCFLQFQPYNVKALNEFEQQCIHLCGIIIILNTLHFQTNLMGFYIVNALLQTLQIAFSIYFIYSIIYKVVQVYYTKYNLKLDIIRKKILERYPQIQQICPSLKEMFVIRSQRKQIVLFRFQLIKKAFLQFKTSLRSQNVNQLRKGSGTIHLSADLGEQTFIIRQSTIL